MSSHVSLDTNPALLHSIILTWFSVALSSLQYMNGSLIIESGLVINCDTVKATWSIASSPQSFHCEDKQVKAAKKKLSTSTKSALDLQLVLIF